MVRGFAFLVLALVALPASASAQRAGAPEPDEKRYRQVIFDAVAEFELGHWDEAVVLFREAHALRPSPKTHRGLGQALFEARDYVHAIPHLRSAIDAPDGTFSSDERDRLDRLLAQALRFVARLEVTVDPAHAAVIVDGSTLDPAGGLLLNPGKHMIVVTADGYIPAQQAVDIEGNSTRSLRISLVPEGAASEDGAADDADGAAITSPTSSAEVSGPETAARSGGDVPVALGWVSAGLAVAGLGTGVVLWRLRDDGPAADWKRHDCVAIPTLDATCLDIQHQADGLETASVVAIVAGSALAVTSIVMFVLAAGDDGEESPSSAQVRCGAGLGALACAGRF